MIVSPCISLCANNEAGLCMGCGRSMEEKIKWKQADTTDEWKTQNMSLCKSRLTSVQVDYWQKSYDFKTTHGTSMHKYGKTVRNEV